MSASRRKTQRPTTKYHLAPRGAAASTHQVRPCFEPLEDRVTPSTSSVLVPAFYKALLERTPDFPGASTFAAELDAGTPDAAVVAYQIETAETQEYYNDLVQSFYLRFLNRQGAPSELAGYSTELANGASDELVESQILGSTEYFQGHGGNSNQGWLNGVYQDLLGRTWDGSSWLAPVNSGTPRGTVALEIMFDSQKEFATDQVNADYLKILGRTGAGDSGAAADAAQLQAGTASDEVIIARILGSPEYQNLQQLAANNNAGPTGVTGGEGGFAAPVGSGGSGGSGSTGPVANADSYGVPQGVTINVAAPGLLGNDTDSSGYTLSAVLVSNPADGALTLNSDGSFSYAPNPKFIGTDTFTYEASDGVNYSPPATVTLTVHAGTKPPTALNQSYTTPANTPLILLAAGGVLTGDSDPTNDPLSATLVSGPADGSVTLNSDGSFTYTPVTNFVGTDTFVYEAYNGVQYSQPATVTIAVTDTPPNDADAPYTVLHGQSLSVPASSGVLANDTDPAGYPLTAVLLSQPSNGAVTLQSDGSFVYTPNSPFSGVDSFTYAANNGMLNGNTATVYVAVTDAAPLASGASYSTPAGQALTVTSLLSAAYDPDGDALTEQLVQGPSNGTLKFNGQSGTFTYTPNAGFTGNDTFTYQVSDGILTSNTATVTISVTGAVPIANNTSFSVAMNQSLTTSAPGVLATSVDPSGGSLTAELASGPSDGSVSLNADGSFTYTPNSGYTGTDSFSYYAVSSSGAMSAQPAVAVVNVISVSLTLPAASYPQGPWVPIDAGDYNGSAWQANTNNQVPTTRDYNSLAALPGGRVDTLLLPMNIAINPANPGVAGFVTLTVTPAAGATGAIRLWSSQTKTTQINPGTFPLAGAGALPATIYLEGINPTSRTIVGGNAIQANPNPDVTITLTYWVIPPALPNNPPPFPVPMATSSVTVGVSPVVNLFTINGVPVPPNPPLNPGTAGGVAFVNGVNFGNGWTSQGVNPATGAPNNQAAATFSAQIFNANTPGNGQFIQNVTMTNGIGGVANAFTYIAAPRGFAQVAPQNWNWQQNLAGPVIAANTTALDVVVNPAGPFAPPPPNPFYQLIPQAPVGNVQVLLAQDTPGANGATLLARGLRSGPAANQVVTNVAFAWNFTMYLEWQMPAGGGPIAAPVGPAATVIYTLATRPWTMTVQANGAGVWANVFGAANGVTNPGDFVLTHNVPAALNVNGLIANWSFHIT